VELTPLRYFIAIARARHMTRAARTLGVSQPALSAAMRRLEDEVGSPLLDRTGRGVEMTAAGSAFLARAEEAVRAADAGLRAVRELVGLETGSIRIGGGATATAFILPPVVSTIRRQHPGLRFYVREAGSTAIAEAVISGELDLGIVTLPLRKADEEQLLTIKLVQDELRLITPPLPAGHPLAGKKTFRWRDLEGQSVIAFEAGSAIRAVLDEAAGASGVRLNVVMELRSIESIRRMVSAGVGVGFVSRFALKAGDGMPCAQQKLARDLAIVRRRDKMPSPGAAAFEELLRSSVRG
jgi:DNA-binding transcriptional LysR family regulator